MADYGFTWRGREFMSDVADALRAALVELGNRAIEHMHHAMETTPPKLGAKPRRGQYRPPSAPGHAPAVQTGTLFTSLAMDTSELDDPDTPTVRVGPMPTAPYGLWLERGTETVEPRPFLRPALRYIEQIADEAIEGSVHA